MQQLAYFLAAADHGSFSAAANALLMAQPSLSEQIRRLEAELGVPLFVRAGRGLELTEAGRLLRPHAERTLAEAQEALESVREVRDLTGGTVAFGIFGGAHHSLLGGLVQDFRAQLPAGAGAGDRPELGRGGRRRPRRAAGGRPGRPAGRGPRARGAPGVRREELLYVSADPERVSEPVTIERLARRAADPLRRPLGRRGPDPPPAARAGAAAGVRLEPLIEVEYMTAALDLAARGLGDTVAPRTRCCSARAGSAASSFDPPLFETFAFITRRNAHLSPTTRAFMAMAERRVQALAGRIRSTHGRGSTRPSPKRNTSRPSSGCTRPACR